MEKWVFIIDLTTRHQKRKGEVFPVVNRMDSNRCTLMFLVAPACRSVRRTRYGYHHHFHLKPRRPHRNVLENGHQRLSCKFQYRSWARMEKNTLFTLYCFYNPVMLGNESLMINIYTCFSWWLFVMQNTALLQIKQYKMHRLSLIVHNHTLYVYINIHTHTERER